MGAPTINEHLSLIQTAAEEGTLQEYKKRINDLQTVLNAIVYSPFQQIVNHLSKLDEQKPDLNVRVRIQHIKEQLEVLKNNVKKM